MFGKIDPNALVEVERCLAVFLGIRLVQTREAEQAARLVALREAVAVGVADIEAGRYTEFADAASLDAYLAKVADRAISGVA